MMMNRRDLLKQSAVAFTVAIATEITTEAQTKTKTNPSPKQIASDLLKLANKIQSSQMSKPDRDKYSELIEEISAKIVKDYNTGSLCSTDEECFKKFGNQAN